MVGQQKKPTSTTDTLQPLNLAVQTGYNIIVHNTAVPLTEDVRQPTHWVTGRNRMHSSWEPSQQCNRTLSWLPSSRSTMADFIHTRGYCAPLPCRALLRMSAARGACDVAGHASAHGWRGGERLAKTPC